jgi:tRNA (guanosine-2'-O-)-methyltransferase
LISEERIKKIEDLTRFWQRDLTVVLENVHDPHNLGAVIRTCDAAGIREVHVIYNEFGPNSEEKYVGKHASKGALKWVEVHFYKDIESCIQVLRAKNFKIFSTHLNESSVSIYEMDFTIPTAIVLGNERDGVSKQMLEYCDGNINIPMFGMVQSLNVSTAAAVIIFEMVRQRMATGAYDRALDVSNAEVVSKFSDYISKARARVARQDKSVMEDFINTIINSKKE